MLCRAQSRREAARVSPLAPVQTERFRRFPKLDTFTTNSGIKDARPERHSTLAERKTHLMLFERIFARAYEPFAAVPGPKPCFPLGNAFDFIGHKESPWEVFSKYGERFGGMSVMWMLNQPSIVLHDPKLISEVLITRRDQFFKDEPCGALIPVLTRSSPNINNGLFFCILNTMDTAR